MALEVARAYDENKNLVPLYILTDDDPVYEPVSPGFIWSFDNYGTMNTPDLILIISSNGMNPTGGVLDVSDSRYTPLSEQVQNVSNVTVTIKNNSSFDIIVSGLKILLYHETGTSRIQAADLLISSLSINKGQSVVSGTFNDLDTGTYKSSYGLDSLTVSRVL